MNDPEFELLKKRFKVGLIGCIVLLVPFFLFFYNKLNQDDSKIVRDIKKQETFFIYIRENKTSSSFKKEIKNSGISFQEVNKDLNRDYPNILRALEIPESDVVVPALIYVKEGKTFAILNDIKEEEELKTFVDNYKGGIE